jgi:hypothetical protein
MNRELLQNIIDQQADQIDFMCSLLLLTTIAAAALLLWVIILRGLIYKKPKAKLAEKRDIIIIIGPKNSGKTLLRKQLCGNRLTMVIPSNELCYDRRFVGLHLTIWKSSEFISTSTRFIGIYFGLLSPY